MPEFPDCEADPPCGVLPVLDWLGAEGVWLLLLSSSIVESSQDLVKADSGPIHLVYRFLVGNLVDSSRYSRCQGVFKSCGNIVLQWDILEWDARNPVEAERYLRVCPS